MENTLLNTDRRTFLISFQWKITEGKYIFQEGKDLVRILKQNDKGIEFIKEFDPAKGVFKRVSKIDILNRFSWETETHEYLKNHSYFKK